MGKIINVDFATGKKLQSVSVLRPGDMILWHEFIADHYITSEIVGIYKYRERNVMVETNPENDAVAEILFSETKNYSFKIRDEVYGVQWIIGELILSKLPNKKKIDVAEVS